MHAAKALHSLPSPTTENANSDALRQPLAKLAVSDDGDAQVTQLTWKQKFESLYRTVSTVQFFSWIIFKARPSFVATLYYSGTW